MTAQYSGSLRLASGLRYSCNPVKIAFENPDDNRGLSALYHWSAVWRSTFSSWWAPGQRLCSMGVPKLISSSITANARSFEQSVFVAVFDCLFGLEAALGVNINTRQDVLGTYFGRSLLPSMGT